MTCPPSNEPSSDSSPDGTDCRNLHKALDATHEGGLLLFVVVLGMLLVCLELTPRTRCPEGLWHRSDGVEEKLWA